ncbi:MAG: hypothetical protein M3T96_09910, partial [Acidobacteriota bacterium]|nr:hypothetical protein [Acidobacteriota bacterium]
MRDLAFDALVKEKEWSGLDDWYETLLEDETLADLRVNGSSYTGLTTIMYYSPPEKRLARMLKLAESSNPTIRKAAIRNLILLADGKNLEVIRVLLPWLENPDWAQEVNGERGRLIYTLSTIKMPESVPGLIAVLNEKQNRQMPTMASNRMTSNSMMSNGNVSVMRDDQESRMLAMQSEYVYRSAAVSALATQKDGRAIAPLREILSQVESWQAGNVVRALVASGGFTIPEQVEALETVAANYGRDPGNIDISESQVASNTVPTDSKPPMPRLMVGNVAMQNSLAERSLDPTQIKFALGQQLAAQTEADENLVTALIDRIEVLRTKNPPTAYGLRQIMMKWRGAAINQMLMRDVKNDRADTDTIVKLLSLRKELRENQSNDIADMRNGSQTAYGISTCLLENPSEYDALLQSDNTEAKTAMLACARLIRAALPVQKVAENLKNPNKTLALAAERYLETEDSPAAQNFVLATHPNEAKILGAKKLFVPDDAPVGNSIFLSALFASLDDSGDTPVYFYDVFSDNLAAGEKKLQKEVRESQDLLGVYAYDDNFIRIYKDKAVFSWQTDKARFRERDLTKGEFEGFKNYLAGERVNELSPFFSECGEECQEKELLMLGRNGGRRIYLFGGESPRFFAELAELFERMRQPPAKLRYALEKNLAGLEILYEGENLQAETVWKNGADLRVLVGDAQRRKQIDKELEKQNAADEEKADFDYEESWKV